MIHSLLDFENILIHDLASMMNTILSFRKGLTRSCDFEDEESLRFHLLRLVNHVLGMAKETIDNTDRNEVVEYAVVLGEIYYMAAGSSYNIENSVGCTAETDLLAKMNLLTTHTLADSLAKQNHTLNVIGSQVTKLSIEALEYNVFKADHVLQIQNFGIVIPSACSLFS